MSCVIYPTPIPAKISGVFSLEYSVSQKNPPQGTWHFFIFFTNGWEFVIDFLHTY